MFGMRVVGGSFGLKGRAKLTNDGFLDINAENGKGYKSSAITSLNSRQEKEGRFSLLSFILGMLLIVLPLTIFFSIFGFVIGLVLTWFGSKYTTTSNLVDIEFRDGNKVTLLASGGQVKSLVRFKGVG